MVISLRSSFQRAAKKLSGDAPRRCQARSHTYSVGRWSKLAAAAAGKLTSCLSGGRPGADVARPVRHPRMETAVAAAARAAGAKNTVAKARPARPSPCSLARLGHLPSAEADGASGPVALHGALVAQGALRPDAAQDVIVGLLEEVRGEVMRRRENASGQTRRSLGLYLHGPVGCGKTLAMDLLVASLRGAPTLRLRRVHFHDFLGEVHSELHASRGTHAEPLPQPTTKNTESRGNSERWWLLGADDDSGRRRTGRAATCVLAERKGGEASSVERVAAKLARGLDVLCFDEVAITTIQDCVIVAPLFRMFYEMGVTVVATSNRAPEALYAGGLNRHIHLPPFVQMLRESCRVHEVLSNADYRAEVAATGQDAGVLLWGCEPSDVDDRARSFLNTWWRRLSPNADRTSKLHATSDNKGFDGVYETVKVAYGRLLQVHVSANLKLVRFTSNNFARHLWLRKTIRPCAAPFHAYLWTESLDYVELLVRRHLEDGHFSWIVATSMVRCSLQRLQPMAQKM
eukprot:TRINITY_DN65460_c0_g1_i1.p1 TRINITY_DN65460_c0_g1~~TRINITY_DN65460_c0_g1_i1.p1  ORF type:complete len:528 (+),score=77.26 TRINITY_DN65460_c0_g1_i1:39-1586(+)